MKKFIVSVFPLIVACGGGEGVEYPQGVEALTLSAPLFEASSDGCSVEPMASEVLTDWLIPVRERVGAPAGLLAELRDAAPTVWSTEMVEWRVANALQDLRLIQTVREDGYALSLRYSEESTAGTFAWADGTMSRDRSSGHWSVYAWNGQPKMEVSWERVGDELLVNHDLVGSGRSALRVRSALAETVTLQEDAQTAAVAQWDFGNARGFVEVAGTRSCLEQASGFVCQRLCDDGR